MVNWNEPQRQSAFGIFLFAGKALREVIIILLAMISSLWRKEVVQTSHLVIGLGLIALYVFGKAFLQYYFFTFQVNERQLIIRKGIFAKKTLVMPFERVLTVQLQQNLLHKIIHHCKLAIDSAGSEETEVAIEALSYPKAVALKELLMQHAQSATVASAEEAADSAGEVIHLSFRDLARMALSANHLETFGLIFAFVLARFEDVKDLFGYDAYDWVESQGRAFVMTTQIAGIMLFFALAFAMLISVMRIVLKYADLTIQLNKNGFHLRHGLLNSHQQFIGARKIQYVQWNANWIRRKLGVFMFQLKTTGENELKKKQKIQLVVTRRSHLDQLLAYYQPQSPAQTAIACGVQPAYWKRKVLIIGLPITIVAIAVAQFWWGWHAAWLALWLLYFAVTRYLAYHNLRFWVTEDAIEITTGVWGRETKLINWQKLQAVFTSQSIYQRRKHMATLALETASGTVYLPFITLEEARHLADYAAMRIESSARNWM